MRDTIDMAKEVGAGIGSSGRWLMTQVELERLVALVRADEREACAKLAATTVCDTHIPTGVKIYGTAVADTIRARK
jgi:hypothetical protein